MSNYDFFAGYLKYIGSTTERETPEIDEMMDELLRAADQLKQFSKIEVPHDRLEIAARAMAGVAGFLQKQILPEVIAAGNEKGEVQVRWVIDTAMELMGLLLSRHELFKSKQDTNHDKVYVLPLPSAPEYS